MVLCGLIQVLVGVGRLGMLIRMVPHPDMLGFVNGLTIVIFMAQFRSFQTINDAGHLTYLQGAALWIMLSLIGLTMAIIWLLPKFARAVPASLATLWLILPYSLTLAAVVLICFHVMLSASFFESL